MKTVISLILAVMLLQSTSYADATRTLRMDQIKSADESKTFTFPAASDAITGNAATQTLTNKTLTAPAITSPTGLVKADVGLSNVDNTSDATKDAATATLTNKTLTAPVINSPTGIVKGDVGLGNVDNTSDATKNSATATLTNKTMDYNSNTFQNFPTSTPNISGSKASPTLYAASANITQFSSTNYDNIIFLAGDSAAVSGITMNACPLAGQKLTLVGESATNTVTIADSANVSQNGSVVLGLNSVISYLCDATSGVWVEQFRR